MRHDKTKIVSTTPAPDHLHAVYLDGDSEVFEPLVCLATIEDDDGQHHIEAMVHGGIGNIERADAASNFDRLEWRQGECQCSVA
ncbi:MAG: hypothetical protein R6V18_03835 [Desulfuromonadaceae bacterium]